MWGISEYEKNHLLKFTKPAIKAILPASNFKANFSPFHPAKKKKKKSCLCYSNLQEPFNQRFCFTVSVLGLRFHGTWLSKSTHAPIFPFSFSLYPCFCCPSSKVLACIDWMLAVRMLFCSFCTLKECFFFYLLSSDKKTWSHIFLSIVQLP